MRMNRLRDFRPSFVRCQNVYGTEDPDKSHETMQRRLVKTELIITLCQGRFLSFQLGEDELVWLIRGAWLIEAIIKIFSPSGIRATYSEGRWLKKKVWKVVCGFRKDTIFGVSVSEANNFFLSRDYKYSLLVKSHMRSGNSTRCSTCACINVLRSHIRMFMQEHTRDYAGTYALRELVFHMVV